MFQDPAGVAVKPPDDPMDILSPRSTGKSSINEARKPRSGSANQDPQQALNCPRCDSSNTKFCYYNNYSLTQPRHFCKNCRRYWTKGGTLRNVPVGGGCRKNKRVKQRLMGGVDPTSLEDSTTSSMLARLSNTFPSFNGGPATFGDDTDQMLNIAFSRFQESMRVRQQQQSSDNPAGTAPPDDHHASFFHMGFPSLMMNKTCGSGTCGGTCGSHACAGINDGLMMSNFENNLNGYTSLPIKLEHEGAMAAATYHEPNYELNTFFNQGLAPNLHMSGTSATATLASIEDQLSNFSNVSSADSFDRDAATQLKVQEQDNIPLPKLPLQQHAAAGDLHGGQHITMADFPNEHAEDEKVIMEDKPLINVNGLSLMTADNWQPSSALMNEMLFEPHHNIWSHSRSWQDMHALATTTAAGGVL